MHGQNSIGEKMKINIKKEFPNDYISREAGERLRKMILENDSPHELDFEDLKVGSISFFDEAIAKLVESGWTSESVKQNLIFKNLYVFDEKLLKQVCLGRGLEI